MRRFTAVAYGRTTLRVTADVQDGEHPWDVLELMAGETPLSEWVLEGVEVEGEQEIAVVWVSPCCYRDWGTKDEFIKRCAWCGEEFNEAHLVEASE